LAGTSVTVNSVLPGITLSDGMKAILAVEHRKTRCRSRRSLAVFIKQHRGGSIIQRTTSVEEVANLVTLAPIGIQHCEIA
jgi:NAD(P)-dependent dehydrogenase (short-subunit alcohol dehydrogenase family)